MATVKDKDVAGPLGEMIKRISEANGWSYNDLARRSGNPSAKSNFQRLATQYPLLMAPRGALLDLAKALGISPDRVALEALRAMGFHPPVEDIPAAEAIQRDPNISEHTRRALLAVLRSSEDRDVG